MVYSASDIFNKLPTELPPLSILLGLSSKLKNLSSTRRRSKVETSPLIGSEIINPGVHKIEVQLEQYVTCETVELANSKVS